MKIAINEIYASIQGEGSYTGRPSIFLRIQGCPVGCGWCDTKQTWVQDPELKVKGIGAASIIEEHWTEAGMIEILDAVRKEAGKGIKHVVITGGEPLLAGKNLVLLVDKLIWNGFSVQIETSGTIEGTSNLSAVGAWITCSPKIGMPGGLEVVHESLICADEIKFPIGKKKDLEKLDAMIKDHKIEGMGQVWLQPLSQSKKATELCISTCMERGWFLSIQTHKYLEIP